MKIPLEIYFEIWIKSCLALYRSSLLMILLLFMVREIAQVGYNGATVCILIYWQLSLHQCESHLSFTPVLTTRMIRALPRRHCRISIAEMQTCPQALSLLCACNTRN